MKILSYFFVALIVQFFLIGCGHYQKKEAGASSLLLNNGNDCLSCSYDDNKFQLVNNANSHNSLTFAEMVEDDLIANSMSTVGLSVSDTEISYAYSDGSSVEIELLSYYRIGTITRKSNLGATLWTMQYVYGSYLSPIKVVVTQNSTSVDYVVFNYNSSQELDTATISGEEDPYVFEEKYSPFPPLDPLLSSKAQGSDQDTLRPSHPQFDLEQVPTAYEACLSGCLADRTIAINNAKGALAAVCAAAVAATVGGLLACLSSTIGYPVCSALVMIAVAAVLAAGMYNHILALQSANASYASCISACAATHMQPEPLLTYPYSVPYPDPSEEDE